MFSLLSTFSLWLGAALIVPLAIHFLGSERQKKIPFPSLLLVRERFSKSMHRHRLKNLLLLLIRTLLILCLLLALANPAFNGMGAKISHPDHSLFVVHNGIYGKLPFQKTGNILEAQRSGFQALDSAENGHTQALPLINPGLGLWEVSERYGDYSQLAERLALNLDSLAGTVQIHIPVFNWNEILSAKEIFLKVMKDNPKSQIAFTDYGDAALKTQAFQGLKSIPDNTGPTAKVTAILNPDFPLPNQTKVQVFQNERLFQEIASSGNRIEVNIPLGQGLEVRGKFSIPKGSFAVSDHHFCFPNSGEWMMVHAGSARASLPSLGRETYYRKIIHVNGIKDIPWAQEKEIKVVYLANDRAVDASAYAKVVEFVKHGGRLIIGVGEESDIPSLNRFLLQPLRLGRFGNLVESMSNQTLTFNRSALMKLGKLPVNPGNAVSVRKHFAFTPDSGTEILLVQNGSGNGAGNISGVTEAIIASQVYYQGRILLWTTDIDNLDWTDLGVNPMTPLLHQALQESGLEEKAKNFSIASDSMLTLPWQENPTASNLGYNSRQTTTTSLAPKILDPDLKPFLKVSVDGNKIHLGPFDKLGIYKMIKESDTSSFAVNLANTIMAKEKWTEKNEAAKTKFLEPFQDLPGRVIVRAAQDPATMSSSSLALWPYLLLASILLLFAEGLIASTFSLRRSRT